MSYVLNPSLEIVEAEGGGIALDKKSGAHLQLNPLGFTVLQAMIDGRSLAEIKDDLVQEFPEQAGRIGADLDALEQDLLARSVVKKARR